MVERFNGRVQREVLGITIHSHRDLDVLLHGFNVAYNARRQRVLEGRVKRQPVLRDKATATFARRGGEAGWGANHKSLRAHTDRLTEAGIRRGIA